MTDAVTESRDSGVELLDTETEKFDDEVDAQHFRTDEPVTVVVGQSVGNDVTVETDYFVVASIEGTKELSGMEASMAGLDPEDESVTETDDGMLEVEMDEASVFISNEDADVGGGFIQVEDADIDDAIAAFEDDYL